MELRPYQQEAYDAVFSAYDRGVNRQLVCLATGLGKTFVSGTIIRDIPLRLACAGRVLWLTHEESLIEQSTMAVSKTIFPEHANRIEKIVKQHGGFIPFLYSKEDLFSVKDDLLETYTLMRRQVGIVKEALFGIQARLVVASVQTLRNRLERIDPTWFDAIIVDECHFAVSPTWLRTINHFKPKLLLGLTATPERLDGISLSNLFEEIVIERDIKFGIDNEYLAELEAVRLTTNLDLSSVKKTGGEFNQKDLRIVDTPARNIAIVNKWLELTKSEDGKHYRQTMCFCVDVEHAKNLCEHFRNKGVDAHFVVADEKLCPDRTGLMRKFKQGKFSVLLVVGIGIYGFDVPDIGCTISAAPTLSKTKYLQGPVGRGTRRKSKEFVERFGKQNCIILDVTDNTTRHDLVNTFTLDKGKRFEDKVFIGKEKKAALIQERDGRRELKHTQEKTERVNLLTLPKVKLRSGSVRELEPATDKQIAWLKREGYDTENVTYTKGDMNEIIGNWQASQRDLERVRAAGYDISDGCTRAEAQAAIAEIERRDGTQYFETTLGKNSPFSFLT